MAQKVEAKKKAVKAKAGKKATHRCSVCSKEGHNARTCGSFREER